MNYLFSCLINHRVHTLTALDPETPTHSLTHSLTHLPTPTPPPSPRTAERPAYSLPQRVLEVFQLVDADGSGLLDEGLGALLSSR